MREAVFRAFSVRASVSHFHYGQVLDNDGIHSGLLRFQHQLLCFLQLLVVQDGVESKENPCAEPVRVFA